MRNTFQLVDLRKERNLSQAELAKMLNLTPQAISNYESGIRKPSLSKALEISEFFNLPIERIEFCTDKKKKSRV